MNQPASWPLGQWDVLMAGWFSAGWVSNRSDGLEFHPVGLVLWRYSLWGLHAVLSMQWRMYHPHWDISPSWLRRYLVHWWVGPLILYYFIFLRIASYSLPYVVCCIESKNFDIPDGHPDLIMSLRARSNQVLGKHLIPIHLSHLIVSCLIMKKCSVNHHLLHWVPFL